MRCGSGQGRVGSSGGKAWGTKAWLLTPATPVPPAAAASAWKVGLANVMLQGANEKSCEPIKTHYPNTTCVWSDAEWYPPKVSGGGVVCERVYLWGEGEGA